MPKDVMAGQRKIAGLAVVAVAVLVLVGCEGLVTGRIGAGGPASDPPAVKRVSSLPPPAWVETPSSSSWMAYGSYCWQGECVHMVPREMRDDIPTVVASAGQKITFHLGFDPSALQLSFISGDGEQIVLAAKRDVSWTVTRWGDLDLFADAGSPGGSASYVIRLVASGGSSTAGETGESVVPASSGS